MRLTSRANLSIGNSAHPLEQRTMRNKDLALRKRSILFSPPAAITDRTEAYSWELALEYAKEVCDYGLRPFQMSFRSRRSKRFEVPQTADTFVHLRITIVTYIPYAADIHIQGFCRPHCCAAGAANIHIGMFAF